MIIGLVVLTLFERNETNLKSATESFGEFAQDCEEHKVSVMIAVVLTDQGNCPLDSW